MARVQVTARELWTVLHGLIFGSIFLAALAPPFSPRFFLLSKPTTAAWHTFGMEWKEHVGWFAPILATAVAFVVAYYGPPPAREERARRTVLWLFLVALAGG